MSITPITPSGPNIGSTSAADLTTARLLAAVDGQSTYSNDIASSNEMTIIGFSSAIISATNNANETSFSIQQKNATQRNEMYQAFIQEALDIVKTYQQFLAVSQKYADSFNVNGASVSQVNVKLVAYNGGAPGDIAAVAAVNAAISDYNSGNITPAQLQTAITTYNTYAASHNTLTGQTNTAITNYNNKVADTNEVITEVNVQLTAAGVTPLPLQSSYLGVPTNMPTLGPAPGAPAPPPFSSVTYVPTTLAPAVNTMDTSGTGDPNVLANILFAPYINLITGQYAATAHSVKLQSEFQSEVQSTLTGKLPFIPDSYYQPTPKLSSGGVTGGAGAGAAAAGLVTTLSNPLMSAVVQNSMFASNSLEIINQINALGSQLLAQIGLQSGSTAVGLLGSKLAGVDLSSPGAKAAVALALANEIGGIVSSGALASGIKAILEQNGITSDALTAQLTAAAELGLLKSGLDQLGLALGIPDLFAQVSSTNASAAGLVSTQVSTSVILNNSVQRENLIRDITNRTNISADILRQSINASIENGEINSQSFQANLVLNGIDPNDANSADVILQSSLKSEIIGYGVLENQISATQLNSANLNNALVYNIVQNQPNITNRQLRDELARQFVTNGATQSQALDAATTIVVGSTPPGVPIVPVTQASLTTSLTANANALSAALGLSASEAQAFSNLLVSTVIGPNIPGSQTSISALIDERVNTLKGAQNEAITAQLAVNFTNSPSQSLSREISTQADRLRDPAFAVLYVAQMYARPEPEKFLKSVSIAV